MNSSKNLFEKIIDLLLEEGVYSPVSIDFDFESFENYKKMIKEYNEKHPNEKIKSSGSTVTIPARAEIGKIGMTKVKV